MCITTNQSLMTQVFLDADTMLLDEWILTFLQNPENHSPNSVTLKMTQI